MNEALRIVPENIDHDASSKALSERMLRVRAAVGRHRWFMLFVVLPTLLATLYYALFASDVYMSESSFVIRSPGQKQTSTSTLANLIQTTGLSGGQQEVSEVIEYIHSRNAVASLQRDVGLHDRFATGQADRLSRFPAFWREDKFENLYDFYLDMVEARIDDETGVAVLEVKAFTPEDARRINAALLDLSEGLVNRLNVRAQRQVIEEGNKRVAEAEQRVRRARITLARYRNANGLLDPERQAAGVLEISNRLIAEQAALQAQLDLMVQAAPENPAIPSIRGRIAAIGREIDAQNARVVGSRSGIASKLATYENLLLEQEFSAQVLTIANTTLEQARTEAQKQQFYLQRIVEPNAPDLARYPSRIKRILTIAVGLICLYMIGWMLAVGIREHAPED